MTDSLNVGRLIPIPILKLLYLRGYHFSNFWAVVLFVLIFLIIICTFSVNFQFYIDGWLLLKLFHANWIKNWRFQTLRCSWAKIWIEAKHALQKVDETFWGVLEDASKLRLMGLTKRIEIFYGFFLSDKTQLIVILLTENLQDLGHLIILAY